MVILPNLSGNPQISNSQVALRIEHHILGFHITMDDLILVQILQSNYHVGDKEFSLTLVESTPSSNMISQIAPVDVVHQQVKILPVLKSGHHVDDKGVL